MCHIPLDHRVIRMVALLKGTHQGYLPINLSITRHNTFLKCVNFFKRIKFYKTTVTYCII